MPNVLTSWKEIANYFGKGVRTVQRWERCFGLPVRRATGHDQRAVLAIPEELDAWLHCQGTRRGSDVERLRCEVAALRAENAALRKQLEPRLRAMNGDRGTKIAEDLLSRSSQLVLETMRTLESTRGLVAASRVLCSKFDLRALSRDGAGDGAMRGMSSGRANA